MLKFFSGSFSFKGIFELKDSKISHTVLYFLFLCLVMTFPLNLEYALNGTTDLNNVTNGFLSNEISWFSDELPSGYVDRMSLGIVGDKSYQYEFNDLYGNPILLVINPEDDYKPAANTIVMYQTEVCYYDSDKSCYYSDYSHLGETIYFDKLKEMEDQTEARKIFCSIFDQVFNPAETFYLIMFNVIQTLLLNIIMVLLVSAVFLCVRVKYQKLTNFKQNICIVVASLTIPTLLGFAGAIFASIFNLGTGVGQTMVVVSSFLMPIIALLAVFKGSGNKEVLTKHL